MWQSSLVLDGLGRARKVPIACKGSILGLGTPSLLRHKSYKPTVWKFQRKEVTSVSDIPPLKLPSCGRYTNVQKTSSPSSP